MSIHETMKELAQYIRMQEEIAETVEGLKDQIKAYMTENNLETLASDEHKATFKTVTSSRIDTTAFKKAFLQWQNNSLKQPRQPVSPLIDRKRGNVNALYVYLENPRRIQNWF